MPDTLSSLVVLASTPSPTAAPTDLDVFPLLMGLFGGLALFLFGMEQMADGGRSGRCG